MPTRRQFLAAVAATAASAAAASALEACGTPAGPSFAIVGPPQVKLPLMAIGQTVGVDNVGEGGSGMAVTRLAADQVIAVSRLCTHQACTVALPGTPGGAMVCPCHGSRFTVQGAVVQGPAPAPLRTFAATIDSANSQIVVTNS
ncbi:MAG: Rieske (2Fe-2S) protein [Gemmatimonadales bacterium]